MKSQHMNLKVAVRFVVVVIMFGSVVFVWPAPHAYAQSENAAAEVSDEETSEVDLYQDSKGEWKVRYLNQNAVVNPNAASQDEQLEAITTEQANTEVDLYQNAAGEWKVRYLPGKKTKNEVKSTVEESVNTEDAESIKDDAPSAVEPDVLEPAAVPARESIENTIDKEIKDQATEQTKQPTKNPTPKVAEIKKTTEIKKDVPVPAAPMPVKKEDPLVSQVVFEKDPAKKETADDFVALTEKIESSLPGNIQENENQTVDVKRGIVVPSAAAVTAGDAAEDKPVLASDMESGKENRAVPMDENELMSAETVAPAEMAYIEESPRTEFKPAVYARERSPRNPNHHVEIGVEAFAYDFEQDSMVNNLGFEVAKKNEGMLYGLHGGYEYVSNFPEKQSFMDFVRSIDNINRYKVTLDYRTGSAEYSDKNFDGLEEDFNHHMVEARAVGGYDFRMTQNTRLTPFMGLGYRYHLDPSGTIIDAPPASIQEGGTTNTFSPIFSSLRQSYEVQSHYFYLPVGIMTNTDMTDSWSLGINLEVDWLFWGMVRSSFSDLGTLYLEDGAANPRTLTLKDTTNSIKKGGVGFRGSTRLTKKQNNFDWYIEPFVRYWYVNKSEDEQYPLKISDGTDVVLFNGSQPYNWTEPENSTTEYGLQVGVSY